MDEGEGPGLGSGGLATLFTMVMAGLAGQTPHMIRCAVCEQQAAAPMVVACALSPFVHHLSSIMPVFHISCLHAKQPAQQSHAPALRGLLHSACQSDSFTGGM